MVLRAVGLFDSTGRLKIKMSEYKKHDVCPSVENKGLVYRAKISEGCTDSALKEHLAEVERVTNAHFAVMARYENGGQLAKTQNGLPIVGPSSGDFNSVVARAHNAAMAAIDAKLTAIDAKLAELVAAVAKRR